jgi:hypothetical protein
MTMHEEWLMALAEDRAIGRAEKNRSEVAGAPIGLLTFLAFIFLMGGVTSLFVFSAFYVASHVMDLPFLGQFFGP